MTETLTQLLLAVAIIAILFLIAVLWRMFEIMSDFRKTSNIIANRIEQFDKIAAKFEDMADNFSQGMKGFVYSLGLSKKIKDFINNKKREREDDEE